jgi:hypothetical protein
MYILQTHRQPTTLTTIDQRLGPSPLCKRRREIVL